MKGKKEPKREQPVVAKQPVLNEGAPKLRSFEAIYREHEKLYEGGVSGRLSPKSFEQGATMLKSMVKLRYDLPRAVMSMILKHAHKFKTGEGGVVPFGPLMTEMVSLSIDPKALLPENTEAPK